MLLAETRKDLLLGLGVGGVGYGKILFRKSVEAGSDLVLLALLASLDSHGKAGLREVDACKLYISLGGAEGVAGLEAGELGDNADITGGDASGILLLSALEGDYLTHSLALACAGVVSGSVGGYFAGDDLEEGHLTDERVGNGLEADSRKSAVFVALDIAFARAACGVGSGADNAVEEQVDTVGGVAGASVYG